VETLSATGLTVRPLDEPSVRAVLALSATPPAALGAPAPRGVERWTHWECGTVHVGYEVRAWPPDRLLALLTAVLAPPALAAVVAITFRGSDSGRSSLSGTVRLVAADAQAARAAGRAVQKAVEFHGGGLHRLDGRHAAAVVATLPLGGGPR
jgi:type VII secretion protein EccE